MSTRPEDGHRSPGDAAPQRGRRQKRLVPEHEKDELYWVRRRRNNEASKRSRIKRRFVDMILERVIVELNAENRVLGAQLAAYEDRFGVGRNALLSAEQITGSLPTNEQMLNRLKLRLSTYPQTAFPITPSAVHQLLAMTRQGVNAGPDGGESSRTDTYSRAVPFAQFSPPPPPPPLHWWPSSANKALDLSRWPPSSHQLALVTTAASGHQAVGGQDDDVNCSSFQLQCAAHVDDENAAAVPDGASELQK